MAIELESIVVRLIGEGSSFFKMITDAATSTRTMTNQLYTAVMRVERFAGTLVKGLGSFGLASGLRGMFNQFADMEMGQVRLNAAIQSNGRAIADAMPQYDAFVKAQTEFSLDTKGSVYSLLQQAEMMGYTGDAAMLLVKNAMDLADATDRDASSMLRMTEAMERGNTRMLRSLPGLNRITDDIVLLRKARELMDRGAVISAAKFESAHGKVERLGRALKDVGKELGGIIASVFLPFATILQQVFDEFKKLEPAMKHQIILVTGLIIAWLGMGPVTQVLKDLLAPTIDLVKFLVITLPLVVLNTVAWIAWKVAMIASAGVLGVINGIAAVFAGTLALVQTAVAAVVAALTFLAGGVALGAIIFVLFQWRLFTGLLSEVVDLVMSVGDGFQMLGTMTGPFEHISGLFGEWLEILKAVYTTAQTNLPLAWELLKAGFDLAVSQIKDLWPPLWKYIKDGFGIVLTFLKDQLDLTFGGIAQRARIMVSSLPGSEDQDKQLAELERSQRETRAALTLRAGNAMRNLQFEAPGSSLETQNAGDVVQELMADISAAGGPAATSAERAGRTLGGALKKGMAHELHKFDAALFGTAEALARIDDYIDMYHGLKPSKGGAAGVVAQASIPLGGGRVGGGGGRTDDLLEDMRDTLEEIASRDSNVLVPAEFA